VLFLVGEFKVDNLTLGETWLFRLWIIFWECKYLSLDGFMSIFSNLSFLKFNLSKLLPPHLLIISSNITHLFHQLYFLIFQVQNNLLKFSFLFKTNHIITINNILLVSLVSAQKLAANLNIKMFLPKNYN